MEKEDMLEGYLQAKPGCVKDYKQEWGWWRWCVGGKMFAAICRPGPEHKGYDGRKLLTLKYEPLFSELMRKEYKDIIPGFYMDKRCWISIFLDGDVPRDVIEMLCDRSYNLVFGKLTKKLQKEILGESNE